MIILQKTISFLKENAKYFLIAFLVISWAIMNYYIIHIKSQQQALQDKIIQQNQLLDNITRSMGEYATRSNIEKFITDNNVNLKVIQEDLNKLKADVKAVNIVTINSTGYSANNLPGKPGETNPNYIPTSCQQDTYGYFKRTNNFELTEPFDKVSVPIGKVGFSAWQQNPWSVDIFPREYKLTTVVGMDENQKQYFYNKFTVKVNNKDYNVLINNAYSQQELPESKFRLNPRLYLGLDSGFNFNMAEGEITAGLYVGLGSYGQFRNQPEFSFAQIGVGIGAISQNIQLSLMPVSYNIGSKLPLMSNTYIGPSVNVSVAGDILLLMGLRVGL